MKKQDLKGQHHLQCVPITKIPLHRPFRFGTHASGVAPVTRQMRINNSSPVGKNVIKI